MTRIWLCLFTTLLPAAARDSAVDVLRQGLEDAVGQEAANPSTKDYPNRALGVLLLGGDVRRAEQLLLRAFELQDLDRNSPGYGTFPWNVKRPEIKDKNTVEFCSQPLGPILLHYGKLLSPGFRSGIRPNLAAAAAAIRRHEVPLTYTNIYLMKTINMILLGEALDDREFAGEGYAQLDRWIEYTRQNGIREFNTPHYYSIDMNSLMMGYLYAGRSGARMKFKRILDRFWAETAANSFRGTLSGPHSRDYNFLGTYETIQWHLYVAGLRTTAPATPPDLERVYLLANCLAGGYRPDRQLLRLAALPEREIRARWASGLGVVELYNFVTRDFAIGSTQATYGPQDKLLKIALPGLPDITIQPNDVDSPYGTVKKRDSWGHTKPMHEPMRATSVQNKGKAVIVLDLDPKPGLATHVVLPARVQEILVGGRLVDSTKESDTRVALGAVVALRAGAAAVAVRFLDAEPLDRLELKVDAEGLKNGALRLTAYHRETSGRVRVRLLFQVESCRGHAEFVAFVKRAAASDGTVPAPAPLGESFAVWSRGKPVPTPGLPVAP